MQLNLINLFRKFQKFIPQKLKKVFLNITEKMGANHYSLEGEDIIIGHIFATQANGFYLDIGAHDPTIYSNTYLLYMRGWRGINIDPRPGTIGKFTEKRPRDITLEMGVSSEKGQLDYYIFNDGAVNTFKESNVAFQKELGYKLIGKKKVEVETITNILDKYAKGQKIDFMSLDVEGYELSVLKTLDWKKYKPKVICVEMFRIGETNNSLFKHENRHTWYDIKEITETEIYKLLIENGYRLFAKEICSAFFVDENSGL